MGRPKPKRTKLSKLKRTKLRLKMVKLKPPTAMQRMATIQMVKPLTEPTENTKMEIPMVNIKMVTPKMDIQLRPPPLRPLRKTRNPQPNAKPARSETPNLFQFQQKKSPN